MEDNGSICKITVDGTDFLIDEPSPWSSKWCSHKFKHAALRYEIGICIQTGWIVWVNGPYPAGQWQDLSISRDGLNQALKKGEMFVADGGYADSHGWSMTPSGYNTREQYMKAVARARHETVNSRLKLFGILRQRFRHAVEKHWIVMGAIINISQIIIEEESPLFQIQYNDLA